MSNYEIQMKKNGANLRRGNPRRRTWGYRDTKLHSISSRLHEIITNPVDSGINEGLVGNPGNNKGESNLPFINMSKPDQATASFSGNPLELPAEHQLRLTPRDFDSLVSMP